MFGSFDKFIFTNDMSPLKAVNYAIDFKLLLMNGNRELFLNTLCVSGSVPHRPFLGYLSMSKVVSYPYDKCICIGQCTQKGLLLRI